MTISPILFGFLLLPCLPILASAKTDSIPLKELPQNGRYAIWGDSITEVTAYPTFVETYLLACAGRKDLKVCPFGHSGEESGGLQSRVSDLDAWKPTIVSIFWGANDVFHHPATAEKDYDTNTRANLALLASKGIQERVVVSTSYFDGEFGPDPKASSAVKGQNALLARLRDLGRAAAVDTDSAFADIYDRMKDSYTAAEQKYGPTYEIGVHVLPNGSLLIAHEILKTLGCDGNIGVIDVDMRGGAQASAGHAVVSGSNGIVVLDSSKYPFCYNYDIANSQGTNCLDSILPYVPFTQELNRFTLTVKNLDAASARVTWGGETKEFSKEQLAQGINLVEQFDHTPFDATFAKVVAAVEAKQTYENFMIKGTSNYFGNDKGGNVDNNMIAAENEKDAALKALITPVRHTIAITPIDATAKQKPVITGTMMAYATAGQLFSYQISALNSPIVFTATNLPTGMRLDAKSGQIAGKPVEPGVYVIPVTASNDNGSSVPTALTLTVLKLVPPLPAITSPKTATATAGAPFTYQITASNQPTLYFAWMPSDNGTAPPASSLPVGLTYDTKSGLVSGTPIKSGTYTLQVAAMNDAGVSPAPLSLIVKEGPGSKAGPAAAN